MKDCPNCNCGMVAQLVNRITRGINSIICAINNIPSTSSDVIEMMLAQDNPMTVAGEYPTALEDRFVVSTSKVRLLDMLNTNLYIIFKIDNNSYNLPVYFKDSVDYEHKVVLPDNTPVLANQLQLNGIYAAKYQYDAGCIILDSLTPLNPNIITV